jgi:DNA mismatch endonuclease (patch repair protein)
MDTFSVKERSEVMRRVAGKNTKPEMVVRSMVHGMGFRYRLHDASLPGKPDIVLKSRKQAVFVHGCFWHGHDCRAGQNRPGSNTSYWFPKLDRNKARDRDAVRQLKRLGWRVLVLWECQLKNAARLQSRLERFLQTPNA